MQALIQSRVAAGVLKRVRADALSRGETIASWLRRVILQETGILPRKIQGAPYACEGCGTSLPMTFQGAFLRLESPWFFEYSGSRLRWACSIACVDEVYRARNQPA